MQYDVLDRIREQYKGMSKGHKKIASFILEHYDQAVFMTAARLGDALRISESTVVRFAAGIGYRGYPEFQRALEECVQNKLSSVQKIDAKYGHSTRSSLVSTGSSWRDRSSSSTLAMW